MKGKHEDYMAMQLNNGTWAWRCGAEMKFAIRERRKEEDIVMNEKY
jgi:hypothetical protein